MPAILASAAGTAKPLAITTTAFPAASVGTAYSATLTSSGGTAPYTWSISSGRLPGGLSLTSSTGKISGTPTAAGKFTFTIAISDKSNPQQKKSATLSIAVSVKPLTITTSSLGSGTVSTSYSQILNANGGTPSYTWSITSGALPAGLALNSTKGVISGTPAASGAFSITVTSVDTSNPQQKTSAPMAVVIAANSSAAPMTIATPSLTGATAGTPYSATLLASGGTPAYTWSITSGALPAGMALSANGVLSGIPTASGTFSFAATVKDSGNPVQTKSSSMSIAVAAVPLKVTTTQLPAATVGTTFAQTLQASGGTRPYGWTIGGQLPAGLSLNSSTGLISGVPVTGGSTSFTVTAQDSGNPAQSAMGTLTISVASGVSALAIVNSTPASGTTGQAYSTTLQAAGGTPAYLWSISAGSLPAGLTLASTTGIISGMPTGSGTSNFTVKVIDNGSPVQTQSLATSIAISPASQVATGLGTTWYVRTDGGTRYSSIVTTGQCDGQGDLPYPGSGVNQHCAFKDVRYLWQDTSYSTGASFPSWGWVIAGGDTVILRGSIAGGVSYRVGWNNTNNSCDSTGCWGIAGNPFDSGAPAPPSGTALQHTRILGENYQACTAQTARTQLHGGWGVSQVLSLGGSSYVDVGCLDITDYSACGRSNDVVDCETNGQVVSDFANDAITLNNTSTHITLTDVRLHGLAGAGIQGAPGDGFVATDIVIVGNANSGWNADDNSGTTGVGSMLVQNYNISWNGCAEEYPIVDAIPYFSCTDQSYGGYGDGFGTATVPSQSPGWQVHFDNGIVSYNTQDGLDALHISGPGSTMTITRTIAFGNEGQQLKVGGATATIQNSVINGNCAAILETLPGRPVPTQDSLGSICRAGNTAVVVTTTAGLTTKFQDNTLFTQGSIGIEVEYADAGNLGPTNSFQYNNNIFYGFYNAGNQAYPTPVYSSTDLNMLTNPGGSWSNNAYFGYRVNWQCQHPGESNAVCSDPGLVDETYHKANIGNMAPATSSSPVVGAGMVIPAIPVDYSGQTRKNPPSIGAYDSPSAP